MPRTSMQRRKLKTKDGNFTVKPAIETFGYSCKFSWNMDMEDDMGNQDFIQGGLIYLVSGQTSNPNIGQSYANREAVMLRMIFRVKLNRDNKSFLLNITS